ncbi:MAG: Ubiquinone/menaquinone biosynthesis C-methyltransferase UbiE [Anaerolineae bacterium]|nr:Ubiquinone/menaquinone biosynthesis C-methyltransferase UbiE [Anaerolineae bacterium]
MIEETLSSAAAQQFYDRLGAGHDRAEFYEARAKQRGLELLAARPGQRILNVGVGTGKEHLQIQAAAAPNGQALGLDLSPVMLRLAHQRTGAPLCRANARFLPYPAASFDALFSSYMLDLIPVRLLPAFLAEFWRALKPGGRLVLVSLTEGVNLPSRALVGLWKTAYAISPTACGGCRPLQLAGMVAAAGFSHIDRDVIVQMAFPSEVISARR